jgi:CRISPR-associated endonuclease/helicase Cas3
LKDKLTTDNLIDFANEKYTGEGSLLIVVNTIRRSLEVYEALKNQYEDSDVEILYLSTNIIPLSRKKVIQKARELLDPENKKNMIMVSTQTIEAGVDLDFDMGIRDLAPVASIIQTAGRINREGKKEIHRPLYIVNIEDDCEKVYSMSKTYNSRNMLDRVINEEDYFNTIEAYYANQLNVTALDESVHIIEDGIKKLNYEKIEKFELIKNLPGIVDVFVEADNQATELAEQYEKTRKALKEASKELKYKYKIKLKEILKKMGNYIISVRSNRLKDGNNPPEFFHRNGIDADFLWIPPDDDLEIYYSKETGFKDESGSAFIF